MDKTKCYKVYKALLYIKIAANKHCANMQECIITRFKYNITIHKTNINGYWIVNIDASVVDTRSDVFIQQTDMEIDN